MSAPCALKVLVKDGCPLHSSAPGRGGKERGDKSRRRQQRAESTPSSLGPPSGAERPLVGHESFRRRGVEGGATAKRWGKGRGGMEGGGGAAGSPAFPRTPQGSGSPDPLPVATACAPFPRPLSFRGPTAPHCFPFPPPPRLMSRRSEATSRPQAMEEPDERDGGGGTEPGEHRGETWDAVGRWGHGGLVGTARRGVRTSRDGELVFL